MAERADKPRIFLADIDDHHWREIFGSMLGTPQQPFKFKPNPGMPVRSFQDMLLRIKSGALDEIDILLLGANVANNSVAAGMRLVGAARDRNPRILVVDIGNQLPVNTNYIEKHHPPSESSSHLTVSDHFGADAHVSKPVPGELKETLKYLWENS